MKLENNRGSKYNLRNLYSKCAGYNLRDLCGKRRKMTAFCRRLCLIGALSLMLFGCGKEKGDENLTPTAQPGNENVEGQGGSVTPEEGKTGEGTIGEGNAGEGTAGENTGEGTTGEDIQGSSENNETDTRVYSLVKVDENTTHQVMESFGASGAWWAQYVGGWDQPYGDDPEVIREKIARLLYSPETGIGLNSYRYNIGAGSATSRKGDYWDEYRRTQSFLLPSGEYNFGKDANAVWFLKEVVKLGAEEITLFCNSPPESLTINGMAHMTKASKSNILPENYGAFADYCFDVAEHFISEGIPVKFISPINEPQWDWEGGQEGCHYETAEIVALLRVFVEKLAERKILVDAGVEISGPESGEWGGKAIEYTQAILQDEVLGAYFKTIDNHSYWSDKSAKKAYALRIKSKYPQIKLRTSEWCEMVNGSDFTMDSAFNMLDVIYEDLTILDVVSWQCWVAVAPGGYRDGLIYVNRDAKACRPAKRMWAFGNLTKYVKPGYTRVDVSNSYSDIYNMRSLCFTGTNEDGKKQMVLVFINREEEKQFRLGLNNYEEYASYQIAVTSKEKDLEVVREGAYEQNTVITVDAESITTLILTGK